MVWSWLGSNLTYLIITPTHQSEGARILDLGLSGSGMCDINLYPIWLLFQLYKLNQSVSLPLPSRSNSVIASL